MPGFYKAEEYDVPGFCVGVVDKKAIIDGKNVKEGDVLIGLSSTGLHSNGFSLARKVFFERGGFALTDILEGFDQSIGETLLTPTKIYVPYILPLLEKYGQSIKAMAHITGGGLIENLPRVLPKNCAVNISKSSWEVPLVFRRMQEIGNIEDKEMYQTVYAKFDGSAAAPTAGLHFTKELLNKIEEKGIKIASITLHVGLGTFRPVKVDDVNNHHMHTEWYEVNAEAADIINETKRNGGRVICVGTTSCRTIESVAGENGYMKTKTGETDIFIYPGYKFKIMDGLITNFHLPESTLVMLVSAFAGKENVLSAYETAVKERYRFFSFGDAMILI